MVLASPVRYILFCLSPLFGSSWALFEFPPPDERLKAIVINKRSIFSTKYCVAMWGSPIQIIILAGWLAGAHQHRSRDLPPHPSSCSQESYKLRPPRSGRVYAGNGKVRNGREIRLEPLGVFWHCGWSWLAGWTRRIFAEVISSFLSSGSHRKPVYNIYSTYMFPGILLYKKHHASYKGCPRPPLMVSMQSTVHTAHIMSQHNHIIFLPE